MPLSQDVAGLIGFACESILYGINFVVFCLSLFIIVSSSQQRRTPLTLVVLNGVLFLCCTLHYSLDYAHFVSAIATTGVDGFSNETRVSFVADVLVAITDFFGDLILVYRCWIIWSKNYYVVLVPFLASIGGLICDAKVSYVADRLTLGATATPPPWLIPLGLANFILPFCTNIIVTTLIIGRIIYVSRNVDEAALPHKRTIVHIMLESGILYFLTQLVVVVLYAKGDPGEQIIIPMAVQIYGIASLLVIVHAGLGITSERFAKEATDGALTSWSRSLHTSGHVTTFTLEGRKAVMESSPGITDDTDFEYMSQKDAQLRETQTLPISTNV